MPSKCAVLEYGPTLLALASTGMRKRSASLASCFAASSTPAARSSFVPGAVRLEAAAMTRRVLASVDAGELDATGPGAAIVHQPEGAVTVLEASAGTSQRCRS